MGKGSIITGILCVLFGIFLFIVIPVSFLWIYPLFAVMLGIFLIAYSKNEDYIEQRKDIKSVRK